jgi:hypothetical protein
MRVETADEIRRRGAVVCLFAAPALMLAGDALRYWAGAQRASFFMLKLSMALFAGAALALFGLTRGRADGAGLLGGALALVGCLAGSGIITAGAILQSFDAAALGEAAEQTFIASMERGGVWGFIFLYPLPGLAFPAGFLVFAHALWRARAASAAAALLVALGALLFPVGRIGGIEPAILSSSLALTLGLSLTALRALGLNSGERPRPDGAADYSRPTPSASATRLM